MEYLIFGRQYARAHDVIVIGAGIGGLCCANLLAQHGLRVLLLERHSVLGGFCSSFRRKGFLFDAATHFYPLLGNPNTLTGKLLHDLEIPTRWIKMDPVDQFHLPSMPPFAVPADFDEYLRQLKSWFPREAAAIDAYFAEARQAYMHGLLYYFREITSPQVSQWLNCTVTEKLNQFFCDPRLKTTLMADAPHWGTVPTRTSYLFDTMLRFAYFLGNYYPKGSSQAFADDLGRALVRRGGQILRCAQAQRIQIQNGKVTGVRIRTLSRVCPEEFEFQAPVVISNADAVHTYRDLLGEEICGREALEKLHLLTPSLPCFLVHIGLKGMDPERLAAVAGYYWSEYDAEDAARTVFKIFVPTQYDPEVAPPGCQILIVQKLVATPWEEIADWTAHRGAIHEGIMARLRDLLPEIDRHIVVNLAASGWTSYHYTNNWRGAMLGWEMSPWQLGAGRLPNDTSVENLFLVGHWTHPGGGVTPVMISAQRVAERVLRGRSSQSALRDPLLAATRSAAAIVRGD